MLQVGLHFVQHILFLHGIAWTQQKEDSTRIIAITNPLAMRS